jgi:hypothetical protein
MREWAVITVLIGLVLLFTPVVDWWCEAPRRERLRGLARAVGFVLAAYALLALIYLVQLTSGSEF